MIYIYHSYLLIPPIVCLFVFYPLLPFPSMDACRNSLFLIINTAQAIRIIYHRRPIRFDIPEVHEPIYHTLFEPVGVKR